MRVLYELMSDKWRVCRFGSSAAVGCRGFGRTVFVWGLLTGGGLAAQVSDPEVLIGRGLDAAAIQELTENLVSTMASEEVNLAALLRRVLAEGPNAGRERLLAGLAIYNNVLSGLTPERIEMMASDTGAWGGIEELRNMFGEEPSRADLARMGLSYARNIRDLGEEISAIVEEEFVRQKEHGSSPSGTRAFGLLFGLARYFHQLVGSVEARDAAFAAWLEVDGNEEAFLGEAGVRDRLEEIPGGLKEIGRGVPLHFLLMKAPQEAHPVVGRRLDSRLRRVAQELLAQGGPGLSAEELMEIQLRASGLLDLHEDAWSMRTVTGAAWLLAAERPLAAGSAQTVYEYGCGSADKGCGVLAALLYFGPDDPSLASIQPRLEALIAQRLAAARSARREMCEKRVSAARQEVTRVSEADALKRERETLDSEARTETGKIEAVLELAELVDRPSPVLLDAILEYWSEERDSKAEDILVRRGVLERSALPVAAVLPALGDCLAGEAGRSVLQ